MKDFPGDENFEMICELLRSLAKDVPVSYGKGAKMEKEIAASILKSNLPENVMLAEVDNRLVGISIANERVKGIEMYNSFTGTTEEMRGKGIAFGLKLQVIKIE